MCSTPQYVRNGAAKRCAICGLIRTLLLANRTLFNEVRRTLQDPSGGYKWLRRASRRLTTAAASSTRQCLDVQDFAAS
ncbi:hypothetical protein SAMN05444169_3156 [Bradyrhizobium erythrophlei]|jgi:hypothetical protein|uniref:Uncharacterized protein n=1 Tax=Bradyrhizobium erythrophlei TaxID=1437360 RepID=A0A1M5KYX4_9BRAD|nr:hypothetical protein SAMN05444169_3156 [Bradyrhizobium erythrophlei]